MRILATLIDYGIFLGLSTLYIYTFGEKTDDGTRVIQGSMALVVPVFWFLYFVVTESVNQATPGHDICKLKVVKTDGHKISLWDAFKRRICDIIDITIYGIPALICISKTARHQRIGDMLADTMVVKPTDIEEKEVTF
ncbi:MAG: RDD family protein [Mucilaginibacter sp.]